MARGRSAPAPRRSAPPPARRTPPPPAPAPSARAPAPAPSQQSSGGGMLSGLGATMAQGFAFGTGSAVARQAVGAIMGGGGSSEAPAAQAPPAAPTPSYGASACEFDSQNFARCLQENPSNAGNCDHLYNALQACQSRM
eukprot:CAMPEP_0117515222 /NCGR_PEP_ID=MMETSP0784-20121206/30469_1 /TAXON_ID=39447 /ORGANISM="" /LENGTH=138 /DNA_ID=CAMNT_0005311033 /DNA_START=41 /DNA_END=457 /DNA_ORIENTATION=+